MKNKTLLITLPAALLLVAAAFYLPSYISRAQDRVLLDTPYVTLLENSREEFSDSMRLSVPEKLMLLRNGDLSCIEVGSSSSVRMAMTNGELTLYESEEPTAQTDKAAYYGVEPEATDDAEETRIWAGRVEKVMEELRALQRIGALPQLWTQEDTVELTGRREALYIDNASQVSFTVYYMELNAEPYSMGLTVDGQTDRILAFTLRWGLGEGPLNWGVTGAASFSTAWRDYWGMDQVDQWYGEQRKDILEGTDAAANLYGGYSAKVDVSFLYGGQSVKIPLYSWAALSRGCSLQWNV